MYDELKEAAEALLRAHAAAQREHMHQNHGSRWKSEHIKIAEHEIAIANELIGNVEREITLDYD